MRNRWPRLGVGSEVTIRNAPTCIGLLTRMVPADVRAVMTIRYVPDGT